jgi:hypothetical protein
MSSVALGTICGTTVATLDTKNTIANTRQYASQQQAPHIRAVRHLGYAQSRALGAHTIVRASNVALNQKTRMTSREQKPSFSAVNVALSNCWLADVSCEAYWGGVSELHLTGSERDTKAFGTRSAQSSTRGSATSGSARKTMQKARTAGEVVMSA